MVLATLIALLSAAPTSAAALRPGSCLRASKDKPAPKTFDDFRDCQAGAREDLIAASEKKGAPLTAGQLDAIDDDQRAEARRFMSRPQRFAKGPAKPLAANLKRVDPKAGASLAALQERLHAAAGDGKDGITPAMAEDIRATLTQAQGSLSPDMKALLDALQKDGGKLTPDTMKMIQGAARAAKSSGLDLNIDPSAEKEILNHDFEADKPAFNAAQPPASN